MRWIFIALLAAGAWAEGDAPELERVGTVGKIPPKLATMTIEVRGDGTLVVDQKPRTFKALRGYLLAAELAVVPNVYIKADKNLPWQAVQWLMAACAQAKRDRLFFAVKHEGDGKQGAMALFLPGRVTVVWQKERIEPHNFRVALRPDGRAGTPRELYATLRQLLAGLKPKQRQHAQIELAAAPATPLGAVLKTCDAIIRAGILRIAFRGPAAPPPNADLKALVAKLRGQTPRTLSIRLAGKPVPPTGERMPPVERATDDFRGARLPFLDGEEEEEEIVEEHPEPELPEEVVADDKNPFAKMRGVLSRAIDWLAKQQQPDGSWKGGPAGNGAAVLALVWSGSTAKRGSMAGPVQKGARYLLANHQRATSDLKADALATLAFAELALRDTNPLYSKGATAGCKGLLSRRGKDGSWGDRETNVLCLAAIRSALIAGVSLEGVNGLEINRSWFAQVDHPDFQAKSDTPMEWVLGTIAMHVAGGRQWMDWQVKMYKMLMDRNKEDGSWGDAYTTALMAMIGRRILD